MSSRFELLGIILLWPGLAFAAPESARLLTPTELASMDRENVAWHMVRVEEDAAANIQRLRDKGFTADEVQLIEPRLAAIWDITIQRNYGWLSKETIERILEVDRGFIVRLRAARLYAETGIRAGAHETEKLETVGRDWQRALRNAMDSRELTEFRLLNSRPADQVAQLVKGLEVSIDEFRTICEWQREYDEVQGPPGKLVNRSQHTWRNQALLDHWTRIRELLGDQRFAVYLSRVSPSFAQVNQAVGQLDGAGPATALDLWWLRKKYEITLMRVNGDSEETQNAIVDFREKVAALLGPVRYEAYEQFDDSIWSDRPMLTAMGSPGTNEGQHWVVPVKASSRESK